MNIETYAINRGMRGYTLRYAPYGDSTADVWSFSSLKELMDYLPVLFKDDEPSKAWHVPVTK